MKETVQNAAIEFRQRFTKADVEPLAKAYGDGLTPRDRVLEARILGEIAPKARKRKHFTRDELIEICRWKSSRSAPRAEANDEDYVQTVTATALGTSCERLRIQVLTLLDGVEWPTASVLLHFGAADPLDPKAIGFPILDFRALSSLNVAVPSQYRFDFWWRYVEHCRQLAKDWKVPMRTLDRALWRYSKDGDV